MGKIIKKGISIIIAFALIVSLTLSYGTEAIAGVAEVYGGLNVPKFYPKNTEELLVCYDAFVTGKEGTIVVYYDNLGITVSDDITDDNVDSIEHSVDIICDVNASISETEYMVQSSKKENALVHRLADRKSVV